MVFILGKSQIGKLFMFLKSKYLSYIFVKLCKTNFGSIIYWNPYLINFPWSWWPTKINYFSYGIGKGIWPNNKRFGTMTPWRFSYLKFGDLIYGIFLIFLFFEISNISRFGELSNLIFWRSLKKQSETLKIVNLSVTISGNFYKCPAF